MLDAQFDKGVEALQRVLDNAALRGDDLGIAASLVGDLLGSHRADSALLPLLMFSLPEHDEHAVVLLQKLKSRIDKP